MTTDTHTTARTFRVHDGHRRGDDAAPATRGTAWGNYLDAVAELDAARRNASASVASQERSATSARTDLAGVRRRIEQQRARLTNAAMHAHRPAPVLEPHASDRSNASILVPADVMDPTPGVNAALTAAWAALGASDAILEIVAEAPSGGGLLPSWQPRLRNLIPYGWYALLATIALVFINRSGSSSNGARLIALAFDFAVPAGAFLLGVVSIDLLFALNRDGRKPKNMRAGLLICAIPLALGVVLSLL